MMESLLKRILPLSFVIAYIPLCLTAFFFVQTDMNAWDMQGHLLAAKNFSLEIFPFLSGWSRYFFAGYPQGYLYPSLFNWLVALGSFLVPLEVSFKLLICLTLLAFPLSWYWVGKNHGFSQKTIAAAIILQTILYYIPKNAMGGEVFGTFLIGLVNQHWAMLPFFILVGALGNIQSHKNWVVAGLSLGIICLSHAFILFVSSLIFLCYMVSSPKKNYPFFLKAGVLSLMLGATWWLPFLTYISWGNGNGIRFFTLNQIWGNETLAMITIYVVSLSLVSFLIKKMSIQREKYIAGPLRSLFVALLVISIFPVSIDLLAENFFPGLYQSFPLHLYRFLFPMLSLLFFLLAPSIEKKQFLVISFFAWFCAYYGLSFSHKTLKAQINIGFDIDKNTRILSHQGAFSSYDVYLPHKLTDTISSAGYQSLNGLFVESSKHSSFIFSVLNSLYKNPMVWGVSTLPFTSGLLDEQFNALGVGGFISNQPLPSEARRQLSFSGFAENVHAEYFYNKSVGRELFHGYLFNYQLVENISRPEVIQKDWEQEIFNWWKSKYRISSTLIYQPKAPVTTASIEKLSEPTIQRSKSEQFKVLIGPGKRWVKIKESYFPKWRAHKGDREVPISLCSPYMMCIFEEGEIDFVFTRSFLDYALHIISFLVLSLSLIHLLRPTRSLLGIAVLFFTTTHSADAFDPEEIRMDHIALGAYHICVAKDLKVNCWGYNDFYQLGNGTKRSTPLKVNMLHDFRTIDGLALGFAHSCIWNKSLLGCVGKNDQQQIPVSSGKIIKTLQTKDYSLEGFEIVKVKAFADNTCVYLRGSKERKLSCSGEQWRASGFKKEYLLSEEIIDFSLGEGHLCAISQSKVYCAGSARFFATHHPEDSTELVEVKKFSVGLEHRMIDSGLTHTCLLASQKGKDQIHCWGSNKLGQLGVADKNVSYNSLDLNQIGKGIKIQQLSTGYNSTCLVVGKSGYCFGSNIKNETLPTDNHHHTYKIKALPFNNASSIVSGHFTTCVILEGHYSCFGSIGNGFKLKAK